MSKQAPPQMLAIWTIYNRPTDHPASFVARKWLVGSEPQATGDIVLADTLEGVRQQLPDGLERMPRHPNDDPVVVETWF